MYSLRLLCVAR